MNIDMIRAAQTRAEGHVRRTPLLRAPLLDAQAGRRVWVKPECLQHTGSFKFRGAWSAISALSEAERSRGVIAFSSGNHAQGVAHAAARHGIASVIIMPGPTSVARTSSRVRPTTVMLAIPPILTTTRPLCSGGVNIQ